MYLWGNVFRTCHGPKWRNSVTDIDRHILRMLKNSFMLGFEAGSSDNSTFAEQKWEQIKYLFEADILDWINQPATDRNESR
jgi:hypothetical protein